MSVRRSIALFIVAAAEISGAWLVWQGIRENRGIAWIRAGIAALAAYGFVATFQSDPHFGRVLAAYGGIFVAGSLAWAVVMDDFPSRSVRAARGGHLSHGRGGHDVRPPGPLRPEEPTHSAR